ncbi:MAG: hydrogenase nickel incorporation protein HypB, partial [Chloroflexota bacterium]|nr:hydrogenase nickel incorporation protein HypB [Chloroflexota bacterium]
ETIQKQGIPVVQINTTGGCHLDASMVAMAMENLPLSDIDLLLIENVGNLVCPAEFALGEQKRVMILSTPEGSDKPHKYPLMFTEADVVLVNKVDLLPYLDFDTDSFVKAVKGLNPKGQILHVSCKTGEGLDDWFSWIKHQLKEKTGRADTSVPE